MTFGQKWVKILIIPSFQLKFDDITVTLSLIVLSRIFFKKLLLNGEGGVVATPSTLPLSNFRAKMVGPIWKIFSWADVPRMSLYRQKFSLQKKPLTIGGLKFHKMLLMSHSNKTVMNIGYYYH